MATAKLMELRKLQRIVVDALEDVKAQDFRHHQTDRSI